MILFVLQFPCCCFFVSLCMTLFSLSFILTHVQLINYFIFFPLFVCLSLSLSTLLHRPDDAFLLSEPHVTAMFQCLEAVEQNNPKLLAQIDTVGVRLGRLPKCLKDHTSLFLTSHH